MVSAEFFGGVAPRSAWGMSISRSSGKHRPLVKLLLEIESLARQVPWPLFRDHVVRFHHLVTLMLARKVDV